jgi:L-ascorbate metabolism protein UlaG (beta-lactamase superfamily)
MSIRLRWLGWACFEIVLPSGKVLITDPFIDYSPTSPIKSAQLTGADYIALTHTHFDHCTDVGVLAKKFSPKIICSSLMAGRLCDFFGLNWTHLIRVRAGDKVVFSDLQIEVKRSEHIYLPYTREEELKRYYAPPLDQMMPAMITAGLHQMPVRDMEMVNFVFQTGDNMRILMFGGGLFDYQRHEIAQTHPQVALFQIGQPDLVAEFAALSGAPVVIPYHHDVKLEETHPRAQELARHLASRSSTQLVDIEHGKWYELGIRITPD